MPEQVCWQASRLNAIRELGKVRILHVVPGLGQVGNGIAVAARLISKLQRMSGHTVELVKTSAFVAGCVNLHEMDPDEVWVHSMWTPETIRACRMALQSGKPLVRMIHGNLDPLRMRSKAWKKYPVWWLVERKLVNRSVRAVVTCEAEFNWCRQAGVVAPIEVVDLKRVFSFTAQDTMVHRDSMARPMRVLYLGRNHPLKGVRFLEAAVQGIPVELHLVCDKTGDALEAEWSWADVLCLPTLSENFGLVVAEALERGMPVITTDGAPVWEGQKGVVYLKGFRDGSDAGRVQLLKGALQDLC